jgi:hypothetical protein
MECKNAKQKLSEALDGRLNTAEQEALDAHCEACDSCRSEKADLEKIHQAIADLSDPQVAPPDPAEAWKSIETKLGDAEPGDEDPFAEPIELDTSGAHDIRNLVDREEEAEAVTARPDDAVSDLFGVSATDEHADVEMASVAPPPILMPVSKGRPGWVVPVAVAAGILVLGVVALGTILFVRSGQEHSRRTQKEKEALAQKVSETENKGATARPAARTRRSMSAGSNYDLTPSRGDSDNPLGGLGGSEPSEARQGDTESGGGSAEETPAGGSTSNGASAGATGGRRRRRRHDTHRARARASHRPSRTRMTKSRMRGGRARTTATSDTESRPRARARTLDDPLSALLAGRKGARKPDTRATSASLPKRLSTSQVKRVMSRANSRMKRCYQKHKKAGLLKVRVTIKGSTGRITSATVTGKFSGTPTGRCALRAVRRLRFPKFQNSTQKFSYPYLLR